MIALTELLDGAQQGGAERVRYWLMKKPERRAQQAQQVQSASLTAEDIERMRQMTQHYGNRAAYDYYRQSLQGSEQFHQWQSVSATAWSPGMTTYP